MWKTSAMVLLFSCARSAGSIGVDGGVEVPAAAVDAGWTLTPSSLDAWVRWQGAMAVRSSAPDGGTPREAAKRQVRTEAQRLADAGLTFDEVDRIEAVVAVVVTVWNVERLAGAGAGSRVGAALNELSLEQRAKAELALQGSTQRPTQAASLEARFGTDAMQALKAREAEITRAWDALLDSKGEGR